MAPTKLSWAWKQPPQEESPRKQRIQRVGFRETSKLFGPDAKVMAYRLGRGHARLPGWLVGAICVFAAGSVFAAAFLKLMIPPGLLVLVLFGFGIRPRRAVAVVDNHVVVMAKSLWTSKHTVLALLPLGVLQPVGASHFGSKVRLRLGPDIVSLVSGDFDHLVSVAAVAQGRAGSSAGGLAQSGYQPATEEWRSAPSLQPRAATSATCRAWIGTGIVVMLVGMGGTVFSSTGQDLSKLVVPAPSTGMVATATGAGGQLPTRLLRGSTQVSGIEPVGIVPTTPTVYLPSLSVTHFGIKTGTEPAYWKVWWDASAQLKAVVCLQQHLSSSDATNGVGRLVGENGNPSVFDSAKVQYTSANPFLVSGVAGASGFVWEGKESLGNSIVPMEVRVAVFSRGSVVALISTTAYGTARTNPAMFLAFASAEYAAMSGSLGFDSDQFLFPFVVLGGIALFVFGTARLRRRNALVASTWGAPTSGGQLGIPKSEWPPPPRPGQQTASRWPGSRTSSGVPEPWTTARITVGPAQLVRESPVPAELSQVGARPSDAAELPPAGWYPDPLAQPGVRQIRYWDGSRWIGEGTPPPAGPEPSWP
jgi:hypothetical protein